MKKLALIPLLAFVLAACAHDPKVAATVAGTDIPISDVDLVAKVLCASAATQSKDPVPMSQVNQYAVTYLAGAKAYADLAKRQHVAVAPAQPVNLPTIAGLDRAQRDHLADLVGEINVAIAAAQADGVKALAGWIQSESDAGRFTANPRYPILTGSTSATVSKAATPEGAALVALPANQKCAR